MPYKILSLDGGGTWALVQARVLKDLYGNITGHALLRQFDLVIANSGGSVFLGLLCHDMHLDDIISFYKTPAKLRQVFPRLQPWERVLEQLFRILFKVGPKYSAARKLTGLRSVMTDDAHKGNANVITAYLDEVPALIGKNENGNDVQLVISAFDYFRQRVTFFRSNTKSNTARFGAYYRITLGEAIHASTNAPIGYYERPATAMLELFTTQSAEKERHCSWFWDGAIAGFNNPVLAGLVEAITNNPAGISLKEFQVLSLGTGQVRKAVITDDETSDNVEVQRQFRQNKGKPFVEWRRNFHFINDIKKVSSSILGDPPDSATFIACSFLNPELNNAAATLVRINPFIAPECTNGLYDYPVVYRQNKEAFIKLMNLDFDVTDEDGITLVDELCDRFIVTNDGPCIQNQLIRGDVKTPAAAADYLGHPTYRQAKNRWLQLIGKPCL